MKHDETPVPQTGHINTNWPANAVGDVSNTVVLVWTIRKPRTENRNPSFERLFERGLAIKLRKSLQQLLPCFEEFHVEFNQSFE